MFAICLHYSNNYADAQDVLQDGFVKVFGKISQFEGTGSIAGWIRRIMINTALEKLRGQKYFLEIDEVKEENGLQYDEIVDTISADDLVKIIQELSPQYRVVFNLYAIEGYSHKEIGQMLGISEGTSKSNLSRGRAILQQKVKERFTVKI